jgi:LmbE family N-acetylglucosaminyl deacetylase
MNWQADRDKRWREFQQLASGTRPDPETRIMVLAAHPDDETIGASVLLSHFPQASVVFLTDGAPRDTNLWPPGFTGSRDDYASTRRQEASRTLAYTGISSEQIIWLGGTDQEVVFQIAPLAERLAQLIAVLRTAVLVTHAYEGGHPDHDAAAVVAKLALALCDPDIRPLHTEMTSYHAREEKCVTGEFLKSCSTNELRLELSDDDRERKRQMLAAYASQRLVLEQFPIDRELLRPAPQYDFSQPPHRGKLWYECMGWEMSGERWRELAAQAFSQHQVQSCG